MELKFSKMLKLVVSVTLIITMFFTGQIGSRSVAQGEVTSSENLVREREITIGDRVYVIPQSDFMINYTVNNGKNLNISGIRIKETLIGGGSIIGDKWVTPDINYPITPNQSKTFSGDRFKGDRGVSSYTLEYILQYMEEGSEDWIELSRGGKRIDIFSTDINVTYKTNATGPVPAGQEVTYTAELQSEASEVIENIVVKDSILGDIGVVPVLEPGSKATVSKSFKLSQTTRSHPIISYDDPMGISGKITEAMERAAVEVVVEEEEVEKPLVLSGQVNKSTIADSEEVDFSLSVVNKGNRALTNVKLVDWMGKEVLFKEKLDPAREAPVIYTARVEPGKDYTFKVTAVEEGTGRNVQDTYTAKFDGIGAELQIINRVTPEDIAVGDVAKIEYTLKNTGKVAMVDIVVEEPEFGEVARFSELQPGQEENFSIEKIIEHDTSSHPRVYAKAKGSGHSYEFQGNYIEIAINTIEVLPLLTMRLTSEPRVLAEPGTIDLICTVINEGDIKIDNIELLLTERELNIGSILTLDPGDQETLTLPGLNIEEDTSFTVRARGITYDGQEVEFLSEPYEIMIGADIPEDEEKVDNPKLSFLKKLLAVIVVLAIATAGGMVYLIRDLRLGDKKKVRKRRKVRRKNANPKN